LLYPLRTPHNIAPYKSKGLDRASELDISWDSAEQSSQSTKRSQDEHRSQHGMHNNEYDISYGISLIQLRII
jgi:ariadne-1